MAVSKTARTMVAAQANSAGGTTTGTEIDLSTALGLAITARISNGATGPTAACSVFIEVREDAGGAWRIWALATAGTVASTDYDFAFDLPPAIIRARARFAGNTGQVVTVEATGHELTSV